MIVHVFGKLKWGEPRQSGTELNFSEVWHWCYLKTVSPEIYLSGRGKRQGGADIYWVRSRNILFWFMEINNPGLSEWKHFAILSSFNSETFLTNTLGGGRVWGLHCHRKVGCKIRTGEAAHAAETCDWMKKMTKKPGFFSRKILFEQKKARTAWPVGLSKVEGNQNLVNPLRAVLCLSSDLQTLKNKPALFSRLQLYWSSVPLNPIGCAWGSSCQEWLVGFSKIIFSA